MLDPLTFEIVKNALSSVAEEMGIVLRRSSFSPNIKERRDFSCALFDREGRLIAQAEHIPVHLGAMPSSVRAVLEEFETDFSDGDTFVLNDPFRGGTHLPDITLVTPIFQNGDRIGFAANRAHHSDVGGSTPGSMSSLSTDVHQEGLRIPPVRLAREGKMETQILGLIMSNVRTPRERLGDLRAQESANTVGVKRVLELVRKFSLKTVLTGMQQVQSYSRQLMLEEIGKLPRKSAVAVDYLDDDGFDQRLIPICVRVTVKDRGVEFDFTGSAHQVKGPLNAVYSITLSAVYYVVRCITSSKIPANDGCFQLIRVIAPAGTIVNAIPPAAVAGGNVETSQRVVDASLKALGGIVPERICAACQGTMNNITVGGLDHRTKRYFTYYETIAGGFGARRDKDGIDGIHSHMTNTLNTPVEALEVAYPLRVTRYEFVQGSGGTGQFAGGNGVRRDVALLADEATVSLLGDRQTVRPWGFRGGNDGSAGKYSLLRGGKVLRLPSKCVVKAQRSDVVSIVTPGGGGYGPTRRKSQRPRNRSAAD